MTFHLIGLGLNKNTLTAEALQILKTCKQIYLENYTVDFPYKKEDLEKNYKIKIQELNRQKIEGEEFLQQAKTNNIALLVYGDALSATTHIQLIQACKKNKIKIKIYHNSSILTAISETGLQLYKFGKITSMPKWQKSYTPDSFVEYIKQNLLIKAHTLLLLDIGLNIKNAKKQLKIAIKNHKLKIEKIILCEQLGVNTKITYTTLNKLPDNAKAPYCFIIPSELNLVEKEVLENFKA